MANPLPNEDAIYRRLVFSIGVANADATIRTLREVRSQSDRVGSGFSTSVRDAEQFSKSLTSVYGSGSKATTSLRSLDKGFKDLHYSANTAYHTFSQLGALVGSGTGLGLAAAVHFVTDYNKALRESRATFLVYGQGIDKTEHQIEGLAETYKFNRKSVIELAQQFEKGFNYQAPQKMDQFFKLLANTVGQNEHAMARLQQTIQSVSKSLPEIEFILTNTSNLDQNGRLTKGAREELDKLLLSAAQAGNIDLSAYKEMRALIVDSEAGTKGLSAADKKRTDELDDQMRAVRAISKAFEDMSKAIADTIMPGVQGISKWLDRWKKTIADVIRIAAPMLALLGLLATGKMITGPLVRGAWGLGKTILGKGAGGAGGLLGNLAMGESKMAGLPGAVMGKMGVPVYVTNLGEIGLGGLGGLGGGRGPVGALETGAAEAGVAAKGISRFGRFMKVAGGIGGGLAGGMLASDLYEGMVGPQHRQTMRGTIEEGLASTAGGALGGLAMGGPVGAGIGAIVGAGTEDVKVFREGQKIAEEALVTVDNLAASWQKNADIIKKSGDAAKVALGEQMTLIVSLQDEIDKRRSGFWNRLFGDGSDTKAMSNRLDEERKKMASMRSKFVSEGKIQDPTKAMEAADKQAASDERSRKEKEKIGQLNMARIAAEIQLSSLIKSQSENLETQAQYYQATIGLLTKGGFAAGSLSQAVGMYDQISKRIDDIIVAEKTNLSLVQANNRQSQVALQTDEQRAQYAQAMSEVADISDPTKLNEVLAKYNENIRTAVTSQTAETKILSHITDLEAKRASIVTQMPSWLDERLRLQGAEVQIMETQVQLADNLAMGVAASARMRMEVIKQLNEVIETNRQKISVIDMAIDRTQDDLKKGIISQLEGNARLYQLEIQRKETQNTILQNVQKQAELTRVLRDGWINAINSMNNGVGMFTKIKIDRETRLGTLMAYEPKKVVGLATGFAGAGRREATGYSAIAPGVLTNPDNAGYAFGAGSAEWAKAIDKRMPLGMMGGGGGMIGPEEGAYGVGLWQELIGKNLSTAAAGAGAAPFGTGGLMGELDKFVNTAKPLPVSIVGTTSPLPVNMQGAVARMRGGVIPGAGPNVDSVPVIAAPGEGVLTQSAMKVLGQENLDALNRGMVRPGDIITPGLDTDQAIDAFVKAHPDLLEAARDSAVTQLGQKINVADSRESELVNQLHRTKNKNEIRKIASERKSNRGAEESLRAERSAIRDGFLTDTLLANLKQQKTEWDADHAEKAVKKDASMPVVAGPATTAAIVPNMTAPAAPKTVDLGDRWWESPDKRTADGAPLAVSQPPTRNTAPQLFAALDDAVSLPSDYPAGWIGTVAGDELKNIMAIDDSGAKRNDALQSFIEDKHKYLDWMDQNGLPDATKTVIDLQDKFDKARGVKDGKPDEVFLPLDKTSVIERKLQEAVSNQKNEQSSKSAIQKQLDFAEKAKMTLVDKFVKSREVLVQETEVSKQLEEYKKSNLNRTPGQLPEYFEAMLPRLAAWQNELSNTISTDQDSEEMFRTFFKIKEAIGIIPTAIGDEIGSSLIGAVSGRTDVRNIKKEMRDKRVADREKVVKALAGSDADNLIALRNELMQKSNAIKSLPRDEEGLRAAYYSDQLKGIATDGITRNATDPDRAQFYQGVLSQVQEIQGMIRGGDYKQYQGKVRPAEEALHDFTLVNNSESIFSTQQEQFDSVYKDIVTASDVNWAKYPIPQLAKGGLVQNSQGGQPVIVGEGMYPEIVSPIPTLEKMLKETLDAALNDQRQSSIMKTSSTISPIMDSIDKGMNSISSDSYQSNAQPAQSGSVEITLSDRQMSDLKDALVKEFEFAFKGVAETAMSRVMDELNRGV